MVNLENYSGFDKAAILLQILGEQLAMPLFNSISESDMLKLRVRSRELQNTPSAGYLPFCFPWYSIHRLGKHGACGGQRDHRPFGARGRIQLDHRPDQRVQRRGRRQRLDHEGGDL